MLSKVISFEGYDLRIVSNEGHLLQEMSGS
jgi:hypothetical protein